ncbi:TonB-dependent receptor [Algoriphagus hitonicola]|uniref:Iron complex outermembrane recepter protein n=1 Tax=Algoriphagus hitonicola TaxID=435880 RepID=A0A1I2U2J1_9BACT|nr:TonB-dependent receptor [Algoriphagus hitonicola]SFG71183.1 iron complex outermembrane recepter protein [Algoriphagus hitonicola]
MNIKSLLFTLAFGMLHFVVLAQSATLKGQVTTSDNQPLEFVNVGIQGLSKGSTTDRFGNYEIKNIEPGTYTVFASFVGLEKQEQSISIAANQTLTLNFSVKESSTELSEVVVTDFSSNRFYSDSSFTVGKLPLKDIENPQVYNSISGRLLREQVVTTMNDAMKNATGVTRLWESTGRGGDGAEYYAMRGFSIQPTLVNGMPNVNNGALDPANIETIDVVKGPSGTLFGSAVISYGGLINITTKKPFDLFKGEVGFITGSFGMNRLTADVNVPISETTAIRVNSAYQSQNTFQDAGNRSSFFIAPSFKFKASERLIFIINTEFLQSQSVNAPMLFLNRNAELKFDRIDPFLANYENSFTGNDLSIQNPSYGIQAQALYELSPNWTSQTVISRSATETSGYYHYLFDAGDGDSFTRFISDRSGQTITTDIQQNFIGDFNIGQFRNRMVVGLDYYDQSIFNGSTGWVANGSVKLSDGSDTGVLTQAGVNELLRDSFEGNSTGKSTVLSAYISDVINLRSNLSVMASLRADRFEGKTDYWIEEEVESQTALSPKLGVVYQPVQDKVSLFANYMNGFVNVAPRTVANADGSNPRLQAFDPEQANQMEFGVKTNLLEDKLAATLSYYDIRVKNRLINDPDNINNTLQAGEVESKGVEFSLVASPFEGMSIIAGYSNNTAEVTEDNPVNGYLGLRPEEAGPEELVNFWLSYSIPTGSLKGFGLGFGGNAASEHLTLNRANGSFAIPAYQVFNAAVSYTSSQYLLALKVNNLSNERYFSGWSTVTPQSLRNIALSFNYRF